MLQVITMRGSFIPLPGRGSTALDAVKDWFRATFAQHTNCTLVTLTPALTLPQHIAVWNCLAASKCVFHQIKNSESDALLTFLEGQLQWGRSLAAAVIRAGTLMHITRNRRGSTFFIHRPVPLFIQL